MLLLNHRQAYEICQLKRFYHSIRNICYADFKHAVKKAVERINANKLAYVHYFIDYYKDDPVVSALTVDDFNLNRIQVIEPQTIPESELQRTYGWMVSWDMISSSFGVENLVDENAQRGGVEALGVLSDD